MELQTLKAVPCPHPQHPRAEGGVTALVSQEVRHSPSHVFDSDPAAAPPTLAAAHFGLRVHVAMRGLWSARGATRATV